MVPRGEARWRLRALPREYWLGSHSPEPDVGIELPRCPGLTLPHDLCIIPEPPILRVVRVVVDHDLLAHLQLLPLEDVSGTGTDVP